MSFCRIYLLQARINIIKPLRDFNFGGDVFVTIMCYKYLLQIFATNIWLLRSQTNNKSWTGFRNSLYILD